MSVPGFLVPLVGLASYLIAAFLIRRAPWGASAPRGDEPLADRYELAWLRGRDTRVLWVAVERLMRSGHWRLIGGHLRADVTKSPPEHPLERAVFDWGPDALKDGTTLRAIAMGAFLSRLREELEARGWVIPSRATRLPFLVAVSVMAALFGAVVVVYGPEGWTAVLTYYTLAVVGFLALPADRPLTNRGAAAAADEHLQRFLHLPGGAVLAAGAVMLSAELLSHLPSDWTVASMDASGGCGTGCGCG